jgi:hypothetical protein
MDSFIKSNPEIQKTLERIQGTQGCFFENPKTKKAAQAAAKNIEKQLNFSIKKGPSKQGE